MKNKKPARKKKKSPGLLYKPANPLMDKKPNRGNKRVGSPSLLPKSPGLKPRKKNKKRRTI